MYEHRSLMMSLNLTVSGTVEIRKHTNICQVVNQ